MVDKLTPEERSINMSRIQSKDTTPEMIVRKLIFSKGYRYRLHQKDLPGKPDIVLPSKKKIVFVHGCFWHQHNDPKCKIARMPKSKTEYWIPKLKRNVERDTEHQKSLRSKGWRILVVWECETNDIKKLSRKLDRFLSDKSA